MLIPILRKTFGKGGNGPSSSLMVSKAEANDTIMRISRTLTTEVLFILREAKVEADSQAYKQIAEILKGMPEKYCF